MHKYLYYSFSDPGLFQSSEFVLNSAPKLFKLYFFSKIEFFLSQQLTEEKFCLKNQYLSSNVVTTTASCRCCWYTSCLFFFFSICKNTDRWILEPPNRNPCLLAPFKYLNRQQIEFQCTGGFFTKIGGPGYDWPTVSYFFPLEGKALIWIYSSDCLGGINSVNIDAHKNLNKHKILFFIQQLSF